MLLAAAARAQAPLSAQEQDRALQTAQEIALNYTANLPNFLCTEHVTRSFAGSGSEQWKRYDSLTIDVGYSRRGEIYKLQAIDDKPTTKKLADIGGYSSGGEFGSILKTVFHPDVAAQFRFERWENIRDRTVYVFQFRIDPRRSTYQVDLRSRGKRYKSRIGMKGAVYIDRETKQVLRLSYEGDRLPGKWPQTIRTPTILDYDFAEIGGKQYLLPKRVDSRVLLPDGDNRNEIEFRNYRKFSADVTLTFEK